MTFTDPELAQAGLTEDAARKRFGRVNVYRWPYHENDRAQTERATEGFIKVVTNARGKILGASIVGEHAGELIQMWSLAVIARPRHQGHDAMDLALSDLFRDQQARGLRILCHGSRQPAGPQGGGLAGQARMSWPLDWRRGRGGRVPRDSIGEALEWSSRLWQRIRSIRSPLTATAERRGLGLSAKLLLLTITFVMLAEVLIFVPSVANFRITWLTDRLTGAQLAALAADAGPGGVVPDQLRMELLRTAQVRAVALEAQQRAPARAAPPTAPRRSTRPTISAPAPATPGVWNELGLRLT